MEREITREYLRCGLTNAELKKEAEKMAYCFSKLSELESTLKSARKQIESDIAKIEADLTGAVERFQSGFEMRNVDCEEVKNFETNTITVIRLDTMEVVKERAMTSEERQIEMDLKKKETLASMDEGNVDAERSGTTEGSPESPINQEESDSLSNSDSKGEEDGEGIAEV